MLERRLKRRSSVGSIRSMTAPVAHGCDGENEKGVMALLRAFLTNLGRYNEGFLIGEYLKLPATTEEVQALLKGIGVDGVRYEEIFITDYECHVSGLYDVLGEYESIDELNYLAGLIDEMDRWELEKFEAAVCHGEHSGSVRELILPKILIATSSTITSVTVMIWDGCTLRNTMPCPYLKALSITLILKPTGGMYRWKRAVSS